MNNKQKTRWCKSFKWMVVGQIVSLFGNGILRFALPLYLLKETGSSAIFGMVSALSFVPMVILSLVGGVLADRVNKRNIMVILDFTTGLLIGGVSLLLGQLPVVPLFLVTLMILYGIAGAYQPAVQASVPLLVSEERLLSANAIINQISTLANLLGPIIGGVLYGIGGLMPILWLSAICFFLSGLMEMFIQIPFEKREMQAGVFQIVKADLLESYTFVKEEKPVFFKIGLIVAVFNLVLTSVMVIGIPVLVIQVLGMSDYQLGITQGILALGGLFGGVLAAILAKKLTLRKAYQMLGLCGFCVGAMGIILLFQWPSLTTYLLITGLCFCAMGAATLFTIQIFSLIQRETPSHLIGKTMAALIAIALSAQPIGQVIYGVLLELLGQMPWLIFTGAGLLSLLVSGYAKGVFEGIQTEVLVQIKTQSNPL